MKVTTKFNPKIYEIMSGYNTERLVKDLGAGMTVAIVALPLPAVMATAMAASLASVMPVKAVLPPVPMQAHRVVISLLVSLALPSQRVVVASPLWPTTLASVLPVPHADL